LILMKSSSVMLYLGVPGRRLINSREPRMPASLQKNTLNAGIETKRSARAHGVTACVECLSTRHRGQAPDEANQRARKSLRLFSLFKG